MSKIRVLFVGEQQVGKTSVIRTLLTHSFPSQVPPICPEATIPPSPPLLSSSFTLVDFLAKPYRAPEDTELATLLKGATAIVVVYDMTRPETQAKVLSH